MSTAETGIITGMEDGMRPGSLPGSPSPETGISFREAALRLSISEKTLRARIRSGEVPGWTVEGKRGLEWRVRLPAVQDQDREPEPAGREGARDQDRDKDEEARDQDRELAALQAERDRLADEVTWLRGRVEEADAEKREMRILIARALPQLTEAKALEANITAAPTPIALKRVRWWWPFMRR